MNDQEMKQLSVRLDRLEEQNAEQIEQNKESIDQGKESIGLMRQVLSIMRGPLGAPEDGMIAQHRQLVKEWVVEGRREQHDEMWRGHEQQKKVWKRVSAVIVASAGIAFAPQLAKFATAIISALSK